MLIGIISTTSAAASVLSSAAPSIELSRITEMGVSVYDVLVVIVLVYLLYAKEILSASKYWTKPLNTSFKMTIFTLVVVFAEIVIFKITEII